MSTSKLLITHREVINNVKTGEVLGFQDKSKGDLITDLDGVRCGGGMILSQALLWNVGTCRSDVKGEVQVTEFTRTRVPILSTGAEQLVVVMKPINVGGAKGLCHLDLSN